jgi:hypothetical protein
LKHLFKVFILCSAIGLFSVVANAQTKSSASITQVVTASPAVAATVALASSLNPASVGKLVTYSGTVTGSNNGASPTGTVTVVGITGSQTVTIGAGGTYTCSETPTVPTTGFKVVATYSGDSNFF